jgi:RNA polymerase sigma-70 factor, ECF subfamily
MERAQDRTMDSDERLIEGTLQGELSAFETLVERHRDIVFRAAARIVGPTEAEDVTQDAFLRAFHRSRAERGVEHPGTGAPPSDRAGP